MFGFSRNFDASNITVCARNDQPDTSFDFAWGILVQGLPLDAQGFAKFDLSSIPYGVTTVTVDLELNAALNGGCNTVEVYRVLTDWDEATITWNNRPAIANSRTDSKTVWEMDMLLGT